jgi:mannose/cellobiose epimerase-like protein (N-acyl-D-glucosamine 2-epimerase family)
MQKLLWSLASGLALASVTGQAPSDPCGAPAAALAQGGENIPEKFPDPARLVWNDRALWDASILHSNRFFIRHGWDAASGSFASELATDGKVLSDKRHLIATSRMVYGLAHGSEVDPKFLSYARATADFLLNKMRGADEKGPYFIASVDAKGVVANPTAPLVVNEQAYGLNGLVALYAKTRDPRLLAQIESSYDAFAKRFHDDEFGGYFDQFNLANQQPVRTKSYNSTVYVATSFLMELAELETPHRARYRQAVRELAGIVAKHFPDDVTGWIVENFTPDWKPDWRDWQKQMIETPQGSRAVTIGVTGHNFQAAWFLLRAAEFAEFPATERKAYRDSAASILTSMLKSKAVDREHGGVFDVFQRERDENMWHTNKAWWQQAEALLALTKAETARLFSDAAVAADAAQVRDQILKFYFAHFLDYKNGGEFPVVQADGTPVLTGNDGNKGQAGTGTYHQVELATFMKRYARRGP